MVFLRIRCPFFKNHLHLSLWAERSGRFWTDPHLFLTQHEASDEPEAQFYSAYVFVKLIELSDGLNCVICSAPSDVVMKSHFNQMAGINIARNQNGRAVVLIPALSVIVVVVGIILLMSG